MSKELKNRPVHAIRFGRIRAAIWGNQSESGLWYNVTVTRTYKENNEWKDSTWFNRDDLPLVCKVLDMAHTWIFEHAADDQGDAERKARSDQFGK